MTQKFNQEALFEAPVLMTQGVVAQDTVLAFLESQWPDVARRAGLLSGLSGFRKFGKNDDIDTATLPESIWLQGGLYPFQSSTYQAEVLSSSANDTAAGTGARTVRIIGLAGDDWSQVTETITMNGTSAVAGTRTDWRRIDRAFAVTVGSGGVNEGDITVRLQGGGAVQSTIGAGRGQTQVGVLTIPGDRKGAIVSWSCSMLTTGSTTEMEIGIFTRDNSLTDPSWRVRSQLGLRGAGTTTHTEHFRNPIILNPTTDIDVRVLACDSNNVGVATTFEVLGFASSLLD